MEKTIEGPILQLPKISHNLSIIWNIQIAPHFLPRFPEGYNSETIENICNKISWDYGHSARSLKYHDNLHISLLKVHKNIKLPMYLQFDPNCHNMGRRVLNRISFMEWICTAIFFLRLREGPVGSSNNI